MGDERLLPPRGEKPVDRLTDMSVPTITVYKPAEEKDTGAAVLICPGGGYHILAMDLEGLQDAQRAMSLVWQHAADWGIAEDRIGILGFSDGGPSGGDGFDEFRPPGLRSDRRNGPDRLPARLHRVDLSRLFDRR